MDCSVCGFSLGAPGFCPACGYEEQPPEIEPDIFVHADLEVSETENSEISKKESGPISDESIDSNEILTIMLPFGIGDAPSDGANLTIPYGLDYAPFFREK